MVLALCPSLVLAEWDQTSKDTSGAATTVGAVGGVSSSLDAYSLPSRAMAGKRVNDDAISDLYLYISGLHLCMPHNLTDETPALSCIRPTSAGL